MIDSPPHGTAAHARRGIPPQMLAALADAFLVEERLLAELTAVLNRQHAAVESDDLETVDDTVFATHRILVTLGEARRRRRSLNVLVSGVEELDSQGLDDVLGGDPPTELVEARTRLRGTAGELSRQVGANRRLLERAVARGEALIRSVYEAGAPAAGYPRDSARAEQVAGGLLLSRTA